MGWNAKFTQPVFENIPDGKHPAILFQIVSLGNQKFSNAKSEWWSPQLLIGFEFPGLTFETKDGVTLSQVKSVTVFESLSPSYKGIGLREIMDVIVGSKDWDGDKLEGFDISSLIGKPCLVTLAGVESKGKTYQNITEIEALPEGFKIDPIREKVLFGPDDITSQEHLEVLPQWIQDKIMKSKEYEEAVAGSEKTKETAEETPTEEAPTEEAQEEIPTINLDDREIKLEDVPF